MSMPDDLVPIPTSPWEKRPTELPLDIEETRTALWVNRGNVTKAAEKLKVSPARLRRFIKSSPRLQEEVSEAREQLADLAEDNVYEALTDHADPGRKDSMSRFVLASVGRSRGFGNGNGAGLKIDTGGGNVIFKWDDGSIFGDNQPGDDTKVIDHDG